MNIHVFFNDGQRILFERYFAPSLKDDWRIIVHPIRDLVEDQDFGTQGFKRIVHQKLDTLIHQIFPQEECGDGFVLSDVDLQFFKPCDPIIRECLKRHDLVFQREVPHAATANAGFVAMRVTPQVASFWRQVESELRVALDSPEFVSDQSFANALLAKKPQLNWGIFPDEIWAWSNQRVSPPLARLRNICLHHANCTEPRGNRTSLELKMEQLDFVRKIVQSPTKRLMYMAGHLMRKGLSRVVHRLPTRRFR